MSRKLQIPEMKGMGVSGLLTAAMLILTGSGASGQCAAPMSPNGAKVICEGDSLLVSARIPGVPSNYYWDWEKDGVMIGRIENVLYAKESGTYRLHLTERSTGCVAISPTPLVLTVNPLPRAVMSVSGPLRLCPGGEVEVDAGSVSGFQYDWLKGGDVVGVQADYLIDEAGEYRVRVRDTNSCVNTSDVLEVISEALPLVELSGTDTAICAGSSLLLEATGGSSSLRYIWHDGTDTAAGSDSSSIRVTYAGDWSVVVIDTEAIGCEAAAGDTVRIDINPLPEPVIRREESVLSVAEGFAGYQWMLNGEPVNGANTYQWTAAEDGAYTVAVTDANGCTGISAAEQVTLPSVVKEGREKAGMVTVYPNPFADVLYIDAGTAFMLEISDLNGRILLQYGGEAGRYPFDLVHFSAGIYLARVRAADGVVLQTMKLTRQ